jgi:hypothetical protein
MGFFSGDSGSIPSFFLFSFSLYKIVEAWKGFTFHTLLDETIRKKIHRYCSVLMEVRLEVSFWFLNYTEPS